MVGVRSFSSRLHVKFPVWASVLMAAVCFVGTLQPDWSRMHLHARQSNFSRHRPMAISHGTGMRLALVSTLREYEPSPPPCSTGHLQNLAIDAWLELADEVILLLDDGAGCAAARTRSPKITCLQHHCQNLEYDKPSMPCLFSSGEAISRSDIIMYTNPDFVYGGVRETVAAVRQHSGNFVIVGRRVSIDAVQAAPHHAAHGDTAPRS
jgi:hypothetical protein